MLNELLSQFIEETNQGNVDNAQKLNRQLHRRLTEPDVPKGLFVDYDRMRNLALESMGDWEPEQCTQFRQEVRAAYHKIKTTYNDFLEGNGSE